MFVYPTPRGIIERATERVTERVIKGQVSKRDASDAFATFVVVLLAEMGGEFEGVLHDDRSKCTCKI